VLFSTGGVLELSLGCEFCKKSLGSIGLEGMLE
jgi:hypothetical protein